MTSEAQSDRLWDRSEFRFFVVTAVTIALIATALSLLAVGLAQTQTASPASASAASEKESALAGQKFDFSADAPDGFKARDPQAPPTPTGTVHDITLRMTETEKEVAPGVTQTVWTFGDQVPGPTYRGKIGDTFNFTIVNDGSMTHSMDFHSGMVSPSTAMVPIDPGKSHTYTYTANKAGIYMYHCGTPPVLMHIGTGMYGAVIIDPPDLPPVDHEYVMVQSDIYTAPDGGVPDMTKLTEGAYDAVVFNGYANQYKYQPIRIEPNDRVRVWVLDDGPSAPSSFHVIGTIFDTVYKEGDYLLRPGPGGSQALDLAPAQGGFVEFQPTEAGAYAFVTHKFNDASRGAVGVFQVGEPVKGAGGH